MPLFFTYVNGRYQFALVYGLPIPQQLFAGFPPGYSRPGDGIVFTTERPQLMLGGIEAVRRSFARMKQSVNLYNVANKKRFI